MPKDPVRELDRIVAKVDTAKDDAAAARVNLLSKRADVTHAEAEVTACRADTVLLAAGPYDYDRMCDALARAKQARESLASAKADVARAQAVIARAQAVQWQLHPQHIAAFKAATNLSRVA